MTRVPEPDVDDLPGLLLGWLAFHRDALAAKCADLTDEQLVTASVPPSSLTLLGLVRHMTEMESHYLARPLSGQDPGPVYCTEADPEADIENLDASMVADSRARWHEVVSAVDTFLAEQPDLTTTAAAGRHSRAWYVAKVLEEYARHNGHADLIRERIDGATGE